MQELMSAQWFHALGMRAISRPDRFGSRICNWNRGRYGSQIIHATIKDICGNGPDIDFRRSLGTLWVWYTRMWSLEVC